MDDPARRAAIRHIFAACNTDALEQQAVGRAPLYARLKLAGLNEAPCHLAVFAEPEPEQGSGLGRMTMPETTAYSTVLAIHNLWLAARTIGLGVGWVSHLGPGPCHGGAGCPGGLAVHRIPLPGLPQRGG